MKSLCAKCGGKCCKPNGPYLSKRELDRLPYPVPFEKVKDNLYRLLGNNGACDFLDNDDCLFHKPWRNISNKPLACILFPFLPTKNGWVLRTKCTYWDKMTKKHLDKAKSIFEKRKKDWCG